MNGTGLFRSYANLIGGQKISEHDTNCQQAVQLLSVFSVCILENRDFEHVSYG